MIAVLNNVRNTIYSQIHLNTPSLQSRVQGVWNAFKESIGGTIRDAFFLPLANKLSAQNKARLQKEKDFYADFWDSNKPTNPHLSHHEEIRTKFKKAIKTIPIEVNGKNLQVSYSVIESRPSSEKTFQNLVFVLGSLSTLDNNIISIYPFLASYLENAKKNSSIAPLRVICISQYDTKQADSAYKAKTLDESGQILTQALKQISQSNGSILQIVAHSLGSIILGAALKHAVHENVLPSNLYFDRGPSSIEKVSERLGLQGRIALVLAKFSGWDIDIGYEIKQNLSNRPDQTIFISEVRHDHHFQGLSSLAQSSHLKNMGSDQRVYKLSFDFASQLYDDRSHHNMPNSLLDGHHIVEGQDSILENNESMSEKIMENFTSTE